MTERLRTSRLRTDHCTPTRAQWVAAAVAPDNTDSMATTVEGSTVETQIERETTGGLQTTVDDYVVNLGVATAVIDAVDEASALDDQSTHTEHSSTVSDQSTDDILHHE